MCMGIPEGRGKKWVVPFVFSGSDRGPDRNILFDFQNILLGLTKTSFFSNSLTERAGQV